MISHSFVFLNLRQLSTKVDVPDSEKIFIILRDIAAQGMDKQMHPKILSSGKTSPQDKEVYI